MKLVKDNWEHKTLPPSIWCGVLDKSLKEMLPRVLTTHDGLAYRVILKASIINQSEESETLSTKAKNLIGVVMNIATYPDKIYDLERLLSLEQ